MFAEWVWVWRANGRRGDETGEEDRGKEGRRVLRRRGCEGRAMEREMRRVGLPAKSHSAFAGRVLAAIRAMTTRGVPEASATV